MVASISSGGFSPASLKLALPDPLLSEPLPLPWLLLSESALPVLMSSQRGTAGSSRQQQQHSRTAF